METTAEKTTGHLSDFKNLTLEQVRENAQEIDHVRARCLGSLTAAMFYTFQSMKTLKFYVDYGIEREEITKKVNEDLARLTKIVEEANEMYRRINGDDLLEIPKNLFEEAEK